jgi:hypothetical protein
MSLTFRLDHLEALDHGLVLVSGTTRRGARLRRGFAVVPPAFHLHLPAANPDAADNLAAAIEPVVARAALLPFRASFLCREIEASAYTVAFDPPGQFQRLRLCFANVQHARAAVAALKSPDATEDAWDHPRLFAAAALRALADHADGEPRLSGAAVDLCHIFTQQTGLRAGDWCTVDAAILEGRVDMTAFSCAEKQYKRKRRSL